MKCAICDYLQALCDCCAEALDREEREFPYEDERSEAEAMEREQRYAYAGADELLGGGEE